MVALKTKVSYTKLLPLLFFLVVTAKAYSQDINRETPPGFLLQIAREGKYSNPDSAIFTNHKEILPSVEGSVFRVFKTVKDDTIVLLAYYVSNDGLGMGYYLIKKEDHFITETYLNIAPTGKTEGVGVKLYTGRGLSVQKADSAWLVKIFDRGVEQKESYWSDYAYEDRPLIVRDKKSRLYGLLNQQGDMVLPVKYTEMGRFSEGLVFLAAENNKYGFANEKGEIVIPMKFWRVLEGFRDGKARVQASAESEPFYIDREGNKIE
jgi:hypothetical protein